MASLDGCVFHQRCARKAIHSTHHASFHIKKHSLAETIATSAMLCESMYMIGGSQTHPQQRSTAHLWWKCNLIQ
ncbi:hypothetical protein SFRURICE_011982 [Spodoptera frugiperda]|nr:hypothetical protein SFRURICE_011982 [Spodoptera frugiperda]